MISAINSVPSVSMGRKSRRDKNIVKGECKMVCVPEETWNRLQNKDSKLEKMTKAAAKNFIAGAVISSVFDGVISGVNAIRKNPEGVMKAGDIAKRAGVWGLCWVAASAALALIFPDRRR